MHKKPYIIGQIHTEVTAPERCIAYSPVSVSCSVAYLPRPLPLHPPHRWIHWRVQTLDCWVRCSIQSTRRSRCHNCPLQTPRTSMCRLHVWELVPDKSILGYSTIYKVQKIKVKYAIHSNLNTLFINIRFLKKRLVVKNKLQQFDSSYSCISPQLGLCNMFAQLHEMPLILEMDGLIVHTS